jgi:rod shape-determining protein MreC
LGFFRNKYVISLILATLIIFFAMSLFNENREGVSVVENVTGVIISSAQRVVSSVGNGVGNIGSYFTDNNRLRRENAELSLRISRAANDVREIGSLRAENERLRAMLNLRENTQEFNLEAAEIIAKTPGNWYNTFTIDKGTRHGVAARQPVITADNTLVGYISDIGTNWARVTAITDPSSAVGAVIVRSRDFGIVEGDVILGRRGQGRLSYIARDTNIVVGDDVETSGMGGIYPRGLLIGRVIEIRPDLQGISQYAIIETAVDFGRLTEVFVIKNPPEVIE